MAKKDNNRHYIDVDLIAKLVYNEEKYIKEFAGASLESFSEFKEDYSRYLLDRDETKFRKAGHKIKPIAQMLEIDAIIDEYEYAKTLLWEEKEQSKLEKSASKITNICNTIIEELEQIRDG